VVDRKPLVARSVCSTNIYTQNLFSCWLFVSFLYRPFWADITNVKIGFRGRSNRKPLVARYVVQTSTDRQNLFSCWLFVSFFYRSVLADITNMKIGFRGRYNRKALQGRRDVCSRYHFSGDLSGIRDTPVTGNPEKIFSGITHRVNHKL
jgi:hypothetical protein